MIDRTFTVVFSTFAGNRIAQIAAYVEEIASVQQADRIVNELLDAAEKLSFLPESKPILPNTAHLPFVVRYTKSRSYKLIFRVELTSDTVRVLSIAHDAEDPERIIDEL